jgi:hypothetical protein
MYLRYTTRKKDGKVHRTWRLVRSVRVGRRVIQQTVTHLGELDEAGRLRARALARALVGEPEQADLFDDGTRDQTIGVRLKGVRVENGRDARFDCAVSPTPTQHKPCCSNAWASYCRKESAYPRSPSTARPPEHPNVVPTFYVSR